MTAPDSSPDVVDETDPFLEDRRRRLRWPITVILGFGFGSLMLVAVASVLFLGVLGARENTATLLRDKAELTLASIRDKITAHLQPVEAQGTYVADLIARGVVDPDDREAMGRSLVAALAATPQVSGIAFARPDGLLWRVSRKAGRLERDDWSGDPEAVEAIERAREKPEAEWAPPVWAPVLERSVLTYRVPVHGPDGFLGLLVAGITLDDLSRYLATLSEGFETAFILYDMQTVLAHPAYLEGGHRPSDSGPLPWIDEVGDPVLANIWHPDRAPLTVVAPLKSGQGHVVSLDGREQVYIYSHLRLDGLRPWLVGMHLPASVADEEILRLRNMVIGGLLLLIVFIGATFLIGRRLSIPVTRLAVAAGRVRDLDLATIERLSPSRVREFDEAAHAFNSMIVGLRWFETYLPRKLVGRLISRGEFRRPLSEERLVTVLFTDIIEFSTYAADKSAREVASFLNDHFTRIGHCVEDQDGTIDKYIGDGMMAFWGAPTEQPDHAVRACRAAMAMIAAAAEDSMEVSGKEQPVRLRIGIHTGPAIVGNIGSPGRLNYTLVGDSVNIAQRLEELGRDVGGGHAVVLVSEETARAAGAEIDIQDEGLRSLRGREEEIRVFRLLGRRDVNAHLASCRDPVSSCPRT